MPKYDLSFNPPLMNAAGCLGFAPEPDGGVDLDRFGAFLTNPISLAPRRPARNTRFHNFPGGFLLHTGHPNPGLSTAIRRYAERWARSPVPVLVHLLCRDAIEVAKMVAWLEEEPAVFGLEVGLPLPIDADTALDMTQAAVGELPVIVRLPLERAADLSWAIADAVEIAAFSLGPPRGALPGSDGSLSVGRLYGPAVFPLALAALYSVVETGVPVIAAGGVYRAEQAQTMLAAGAIGVQLDAVLWRGGI